MIVYVVTCHHNHIVDKVVNANLLTADGHVMAFSRSILESTFMAASLKAKLLVQI